MIGMSQQKAKEWVAKAIAFYKTSGKAIALSEFSKPQGSFVQDDMYIFVLNCKGTVISHGVDEKYIGQDFIDLQDSAGKKFIREIVDTSNSKGSGWVDYIWYDPATREAERKNVYFEKVDDLIFCSGVYREIWDGPKWVTALLRNPLPF
ncbi:MAG: cache domain-containing protein [Syntrophales bacterium]